MSTPKPIIVKNLIDFLEEFISLSPEIKKTITDKSIIENYHLKQVFNSTGQIEGRLWFVYKGLIRKYYFDTTGIDHTDGFFQEKGLIFSYNGYWQKPSDHYLESLETSTLLSIRYNDLALLSQYAEVQKLTEIFINQHYQHEIFKSRLMAFSTEERYKKFRQHYPEIFRRIPLKYIASCLNMTREHLSRLIKNDL